MIDKGDWPGVLRAARDLQADRARSGAFAAVGGSTARIDRRGGVGGDTGVVIGAPVVKQPSSLVIAPGSYVESDGYIAIEATHFAKAVGSEDVSWQSLPGFGRTAGGVMPIPVTAARHELSQASPRLEYFLFTTSAGEANVELTLAPTLAFVPGRGLRAAVSFDAEPPQIMDLALAVDGSPAEWARSVLDGVCKVVTTHEFLGKGAHVLKFWMIDPGVVLERIVVDFGGVRDSYLGPPESVRMDSP